MIQPQYLVITSVNPPTEAVEAYSKLDEFQTIVVGDVKTPTDWNFPNVEYLSLGKQRQMGFKCEKYLPENHYSRKNIGYLMAMKQGASIIIDTDDDNIPYEHYSLPPFEGNFFTPTSGNRWINPYAYFTDTKCWPRGLPLDVIHDAAPSLAKGHFKVSVWQGLADHDPDVDAIYRLIEGKNIIFKKNNPIAFDKTQLCPINSQNTAFNARAFPLLYLPNTVSFRFTDILRGLILQQVLGAYEICIGFHNATVYQERNIHNTMEDFESEIPCYIYGKRIPEIARGAISCERNIYDNLFGVYRALLPEKIIQPSELVCLENWLKDCQIILDHN